MIMANRNWKAGYANTNVNNRNESQKKTVTPIIRRKSRMLPYVLGISCRHLPKCKLKI